MSYALIVGGGKIGYYLARTLKKSGLLIGVVEVDANRSARIAEDLDITVISGDGMDIDMLGDANADSADYFVAATGRDEVNLCLCQLAKRRFGVAVTIARVINPANEALFKILGVDATISTTAMAARMIEKVLPAKGMRLFTIFSGGDVEVAEVVLREKGPVTGLTVAELRLPEECLLISIMRGGEILFPRGKTVLRVGDRVFALARLGSVESLERALTGGRP
jgi:trk system potassium uptake protein TrkA